MRILHISDLHFRSNRSVYEQNLIISKLVKKLSLATPIDLCLFTGDLVFSGTNSKDFEEAKEILFDVIYRELGIPITKIIICPGNHDLNRDENSKAIVNYFDSEISTNHKLNSEYHSPSNDLKTSHKPLSNFNLFRKTHFLIDTDIENEFYTVHKRKIDQKEIAIVTINTA